MQNTKNILFKSIIIILVLLQVGTQAIGQNSQIKSSDGKYYYQSEVYKIQNLGVILYDHTEASLLYMQGQNNFKTAKTLGIVGLTSIGIGVLSMSLVQEPETVLEGLILTEPNTVAKSVGIVFVGSGLICGVLALTNYAKGRTKMNTAIEIFNRRDNPLGLKSSLHLGVTGNGMGLVLGF